MVPGTVTMATITMATITMATAATSTLSVAPRLITLLTLAKMEEITRFQLSNIHNMWWFEGQLMNDLKRHHSSQISQHPQAIQTANQIPQHHVSSGQNDNNNNNNNIVIVPQLQQPMVAAPYAGAQAPPPHVTAINVGMGEQGPRRYKREANHLVHCLLSLLFPPWMFVWCIICCCYGCPNICCCCGDGDACDDCCPKQYESAPPRTRSTTWIWMSLGEHFLNSEIFIHDDVFTWI